MRRRLHPRHGTVVFLRQAAHFSGVDIAGDDQDGVIGAVKPPVKVQRILPRQLRHLVHPADDRAAVAMVEEKGAARLFPQDRGGARLDTRAPFLQDDAPFLDDVVFREHEVRHAVRLDLHHPGQAVPGDELVVAGVVPAGEGVFPAAIGGDDPGKFPGFQRFCALEQQMFDKMRNA